MAETLAPYKRKLTEKRREFYKNFLRKIPDGNLLRVYKNRKMECLDESAFDEKIMKIFAKKKK